ncbi:hypothetical protein [Tahibacter amnicola]|uniref:Uncharacterized protein n=1 Tax=Tahibacter amnicola TaxID=2976241 RepID=A0ABY6BI29_9GAMM|nr:hypothetical protein [Tahibacter amnicola]UXI68276.1 hypothetical protein N4264_01110 [Tahibacter amnicola]
MLEAIAFLERIGATAARDGGREGLEAMLGDSTIDASIKAALLAGDRTAIGRALGLTPVRSCVLAPPDNDEQDAPQDDKSRIVAACHIRAVA